MQAFAQLLNHAVVNAAAELRALQPGGDATKEFREPERFQQKIVRTEVHGGPGAAIGQLAGHEDELGVGQLGIRPHFLQQAAAVLAGHLDVAQDEIGQMLAGEFPSAGGVGGAQGAVAVGFKTQGESRRQVHIIVDDEDGLEAGAGVGGGG